MSKTTDKLPDNKRSYKQDRFLWTSDTGIGIDIPTMPASSPKRLREYFAGMKDGDPMVQLYAISALADDPVVRARIDELPLKEIMRLMKAWQRQGSKELEGKSGPSSGS